MCSNEGTSDVDSSLVLHPNVDTSAKWMQDDHILKTSFQQSVYNFEPWSGDAEYEISNDMDWFTDSSNLANSNWCPQTKSKRKIRESSTTKTNFLNSTPRQNKELSTTNSSRNWVQKSSNILFNPETQNRRVHTVSENNETLEKHQLRMFDTEISLDTRLLKNRFKGDCTEGSGTTSVCEPFEINPEYLSTSNSDLDEELFGVNTLLCERLKRAAERGNVTAQRWLKRRRGHRRKQNNLFKAEPTIKQTKKRKTAAMESKMTPKAEDLMRRANNAYLDCNISEAVALLEETIKEAPGLHDPFHILGLLYEEDLNNPQKALDCFLIAAHLIPDDYDLWTHVAVMSKSLGYIKQAAYAYQKALRGARLAGAPVDEACVYNLALCYLSQKNFKKAATHFSFLYMRNPGDCVLGHKLTECYIQLKDFQKAIETISSCLVSSSSNTGDNAEYIDYPTISNPSIAYNGKSLMMLSSLLIQTKQFKECEALLLKVFDDKSVLENIPIKLIVYLGASQLYNYDVATRYSDNAFEVLTNINRPREKFLPLYLLLIDAFYHADFCDKVLTLFGFVGDLPQVRRLASVWVKVAQCQLRLSKSKMNPTLSNSQNGLSSYDSSLPIDKYKTDTHAQLLLSRILTKISRISDSKSNMYSFITAVSVFDEATLPGHVSGISIPVAMSHFDRMRTLRKLEDSLGTISEMKNSQAILSNQQKAQRENWIHNFLLLVQDSELDAQRVLRFNVKRRLERLEFDVHTQNQLLEDSGYAQPTEISDAPAANNTALKSTLNDFVEHADAFNDKFTLDNDTLKPKIENDEAHHPMALIEQGANQTGFSHHKVKESLGLISLENILGWKGYSLFLKNGIIEAMAPASMYQSAVELLEAILENKRLCRFQQQEQEKRVFLQLVKSLSLQMAIQGGMYRVALTYIRQKFSKESKNGDRCLQTFGRLLFSSNPSQIHTKRPLIFEKETLLEARAWCIRQLIQLPHNFLLTLLAGHFCSISGRWRLAVAEYHRAHKLSPKDDLTCLCLATSLLNLSVSRMVKDRHGTLLRGFTLMTTYVRQRKKTMALVKNCLSRHLCKAESIQFLQSVIEKVFRSEIYYNLARAYHQFSMVNLAVPLYMKSIECLNNEDIQKALVYLDELYDCNSYCEQPYLYTFLQWDAPQIQLCSVHNLALIYKSRKAFTLATPLLQNCIVWTDDPSNACSFKIA